MAFTTYMGSRQEWPFTHTIVFVNFRRLIVWIARVAYARRLNLER